jgi:hypothetical protein
MSNNLLESTQNPDLLVEIAEQKEATARTLDQLTSRQKKVLELRYGLGDEEPCTLKEVGIKFGVKAERIRQIEAKALRQLRHPDRNKDLRLAYNGEDFSEKKKREAREWREQQDVDISTLFADAIGSAPPNESPYVERNRDTRLEYKAWQQRVKKYGIDEALKQTANRQKGTH